MKRSTVSSARCFPKGSNAASVLSRSGRRIGGKRGGRRPFLRKSCAGCRIFACLEEGLRKSSASLREDAQLGGGGSMPALLARRKGSFSAWLAYAPYHGYFFRGRWEAFFRREGIPEDEWIPWLTARHRAVSDRFWRRERSSFASMRNGPRRQESIDENAFFWHDKGGGGRKPNFARIFPRMWE